MEYLVTMPAHVSDGTSGQAVADARAREAAHSSDLADQGTCCGCGGCGGRPASRARWGPWRAGDPAEIQVILASLPLDAWMTPQTALLIPHPSGPGLVAA